MKIAILHDDLMRRGGAERVAQYFVEAFPEASFYTLAYSKEDTYSVFQDINVNTTWYDKVVKNETQLKTLFYPLGILAIKSINFSAYDIILMSTTYAAKYINKKHNALVICYCHNPLRLLWEPDSYQSIKSKLLTKNQLLLFILRKYDIKHSRNVDYYITNSKSTKHKIEKTYCVRNDIQIFQPPIDLDKIKLSDQKKNYYLLVSRLESYKMVGLVIEAFNKIGLPLVIIGNGSMKVELINMAKDNITFYSNLSDKELLYKYSKAIAFIFPQEEDYGITPLEAIASGCPVIAYNKGGILETMIPYTKGNDEKCTAIYFDKQNSNELINAINIFQKIKFNAKFIRKHAEKFSKDRFISDIRKFVVDQYLKHDTE